MAAVGVMIGACTEPLIPALMKPLLDKGFQGGTLPLWMVPIVVIGLFTLRGLAGFVADYGLAWATQKGIFDLRIAMFNRLLNAKGSDLFTQRSTSELTNTVVFEVQSGTTELVQAFSSLSKDALTLVALLGYLLWLNWQLTLFVAILFPVLGLVMRNLSRRLRRLTIEGQKATDKLAYVVEENVLAWRIVRLHGAQKQQSERFNTTGSMLEKLAIKAVVAKASMSPMTQFLAATGLAAVIVLALWQSNADGSNSVGSFVSFVTAMLMLMSPIKHLSDAAGPVTRGLTSLERAIELIEAFAPEASGSHQGQSSANPSASKNVHSKGHLRLEHVSVHYPNSKEPALKDLSLDIPPGQVVALVGPSGAGKSTLINLLPRFIDPTSGTIRLDGEALPDWDTEILRQQFALVSQDVVLFNDTVAANVALGQEMAEERVKSALQSANLLDFVMQRPEGIHSVIGHNGQQLSGGQRQRLAIARALYKEAPVLILDEATSALDSESERLVQDALERLMKGRTTLVIAHRLSTIEHADRIIVMEAGQLVESGGHAELLMQEGLYARLHSLQFKA